MNTKKCTRCKNVRDVKFFYFYKKRKVYRSNCKPCYNEWSREYGKQKEVKERRNEKYKKYGNKNLNKWLSCIPKETNCEICGVRLVFNSRNSNTSIHFDHTQENCDIKVSPMTWLIRRAYNEINKKIWLRCNFGWLCGKCNRALPTIGREKWLKKALQYAERKNESSF